MQTTPRFYLMHSHGENLVLHSCRIKSGSGLGMKLATNYAPDEEVMKTLSHCLETILHTIQKKKVEKCQAIV